MFEHSPFSEGESGILIIALYSFAILVLAKVAGTIPILKVLFLDLAFFFSLVSLAEPGLNEICLDKALG